MVLLTWPELELVEYQVARVATSMPYIPGFLVSRNACAAGGVEQLSQNRTCSSLTDTAFLIPEIGRRQPFWPDD